MTRNSLTGSQRRRNHHGAEQPLFKPILERLEDRSLLSISLSGIPNWVEQGPGPVVGYAGEASVPQTSVGAIESAVVEPTATGYIVYAGTVNGGIWRSDGISNGMFDGSVSPTLANWRPLTDNVLSLDGKPLSLATASMALDPNDPTGNTLWVGTGSLSSYFRYGGQAIGLLKTTDGGNTWSLLGQADLPGQTIVRVLPTTQTTVSGGQIVLVATNNTGGNESQSGVYFSGDGGQTFQSTLPGQATDLVEDPTAPNVFYAAIAPGPNGPSGVFESVNYGLGPWLNLQAPATVTSADNTKLAVATDPNTGNTILWVATINATGAVVYFSELNGGIGFTTVGPAGFDPNPKAPNLAQALSIIADPVSPNVAYVATYGDLVLRFTYDFSAPQNSQLANLDSQYLNDISDNADYNNLDAASKTFPHGDFRSLTFLNSDTLLETDDGGIYGVTGARNTAIVFPDGATVVDLSPAGQPPTPGWVSLNGGGFSVNKQGQVQFNPGAPGIDDTELFSVAYDTRNGLILGGAQDQGTALQGPEPSLSLGWTSYLGGDGGAVAIDPTTIPSGTFDPTLYTIGNGIPYKMSESGQGYPPAGVLATAANPNGLVALASPSSPTGLYSGLNPTDQNVMNSGGEFFAPYTLDALSGITDPEPMLYGMTGIYESVDGGDTVTNVSPPGTSGVVTAIAYGSTNSGLAAYFTTAQGAPNQNPSGPGQIWVRNDLGQSLPSQTFALLPPPNWGNAYALKIAMDPLDYHYAYVLDSSNEVWQLQFIDNGQPTTNGEVVPAQQVVWNNITGNLATLASIDGTVQLASLDIYHPPGANPVVLVGGLGGVYRGLPIGPVDPVTGQPAVIWSLYGTVPGGASLPNLLVNDLHYIPVPSDTFDYGNNGDVLVVGTYGRGAWIVPQASATLEQPATLVINADPGGPNQIRLVVDPAKTPSPILDVFQNNTSSTPNFRVFLSWINAIQVNSNGIQTTLTIDESNGLISLPDPISANSEIQFTGGSGNDSLVIDDVPDRFTEDVTLGTDQITGLGSAGISYANVNHLQLSGGAGQNTYTLANTDPVVQSTELDPGDNGNTIEVQKAAGAITINSFGPDNVYVGDGNGVQDIQGALTVNGLFDLANLTLDDRGDGSNLNFSLTDTNISNFAPATIQYGGLGGLNIVTGSGNDEVQVTNTAAPIFFFNRQTVTDIRNSGPGNLVAIIQGTRSPLTVSGAFLSTVGNGTLQAILGPVLIKSGVVNAPVLEVNDSADTRPELAQLGKSSSFPGDYSVIGLTPTPAAPIAFESAVNLDVEGFGPGGTFTVNDTPANSNTGIESTGTVDVLGTTGDLGVTGGTLVDVGLGNVQNINGQVLVSEPLFDTVDHVPLIVDDSADTQSRTITVGQAFGSIYSINIQGQAPIEFAGGQVSPVTIDEPSVAGIGNSITVNGTPAGTALTISSGLENDFNIFEVAGIGGPVTLNTHVGDTTDLYDSAATSAGRVDTITSTSVTNNAGFSLTISYPAVSFFDEGFALIGGNPFNDAINFQSEPFGIGWLLFPTIGNHTINVGDPVQGMAVVQGDVSVDSGPATSVALNVNDPAGSAAQNYTLGYDSTLDEDNIVRSTSPISPGGVHEGRIFYNASSNRVANLTFNDGNASDTYVIQTPPVLQSPPGEPPSLDPQIIFNGGASLQGPPNLANLWQITGPNSGTLDAGMSFQGAAINISFQGITSLVGGGGNNTFQVATAGSLAGSINGGGGITTLDYSPYVGNVSVDLPLGIATGIAGGVSNINNLTGSQGNDVLVANAVHSVIQGGTGPSLLIGGAGGANITGGPAGNIEISGTTSFDTQSNALAAYAAILSEWTSTDSYTKRVNRIMNGGGLNGSFLLNLSTVFDDTSTDTLTGGAGMNFYFIDKKQDTITDKKNGEHVVNLQGGSAPHQMLAPANPAVAFTPAQIRAAYGINSLSLDGTGQTIAIVDAYDDPSIFQALDSFDSQFGPASSGPTLYDLYGAATSFLTVVNESGQPAPLPATDPAGPGGDNWELETELDVEWAHAIAPGAQIVLVETNSDGLADLIAGAATAASQPGVSVVSMSWGYVEGLNVLAGDEAAYDSTFTTPGVTFVASTGDHGAEYAVYPAFSPNVLAVGGTSLSLNGDNSYSSETGWGYYSNFAGTFIGGGGGISRYESEPAYQLGVQPTGWRTTPDVSFVADPTTGAWIADPYNLDPSSPWQVVGGTSLSAPCWGGLIALVNQGRAGAGTAPLNSSRPTEAQQDLYSLAQTDYNVITSGYNGYTAQAGYNLVTGLGSPIANRLVPDLVAGNSPSSGQVAPITAAGLVYSGASPASGAGAAQVMQVFTAFTTDDSNSARTQAADLQHAPDSINSKILKGKTTDFAANLADLDALFAGWTRTDSTSVRGVDDLNSGPRAAGNQVNNELALLTPRMVTRGSPDEDILFGTLPTNPATGEPALDWSLDTGYAEPTYVILEKVLELAPCR
jgi:hypothetical protein